MSVLVSRRLLPDDPPEREGAALLSRSGSARAGPDRPGERLPLLRSAPGPGGPGDPAVPRPGHAPGPGPGRAPSARHPDQDQGDHRPPDRHGSPAGRDADERGQPARPAGGPAGP